MDEEQQYCLRWNNFQANITSQFEALRDDEEFTDVTIACNGQSMKAHKVVLSACSPLFKDLFKNNPCPHPIIFMRDVETRSITALLEFMYAGEVNVAQAHLSGFLRTAESLKIRGLTEPNTDLIQNKETNDLMDVSTSNQMREERIFETSPIRDNNDYENDIIEDKRLKEFETVLNDNNNEANADHNHNHSQEDGNAIALRDVSVRNVKEEVLDLPEYSSDLEEERETKFVSHRDAISGICDMDNTRIGHLTSEQELKLVGSRSSSRTNGWSTFGMRLRGDNTSPQTTNSSRLSNRLVKLADGIEIPEEQLRGVKWNDYRKLTRGLATILFSPSELATCSVTGQRWSRAGNDPRPVKPALDRAKVQAIISYVSSRFPIIEISRIKQVLAYKCKENSTAFKMKAVRYFADQRRDFNNM